MSSTWSNLGLNLQGTGDNSGTWGQLTNVNLQDIDTAISGVAPITLTGNTTLAFTSNSSSTTFTNYPGLNKIIVLSGSLSATTVTVTVPNIQKDYVVVNNSGATVVVSSGGSTTISIPTSTNAYIYSNGSSSIFFALPLPVATNAGGTTNQVQYNNAGAFAGITNTTAGYVLTSNGTATAPSFQAVASLTWSSKSTTFTAAAANGYLVNTTAGGFTATLPASPNLGDIIYFVDANYTFQTNALTINPNGNNIAATSGNLAINTQGAGFQLIWTAVTATGWTYLNK